jgi:hypothetical protein
MGATPIYGLPYQGINDSPNGPDLGQDLAEAAEALLAGGYATTRDASAQAIADLAIATLLSSKAGFSSVATSQSTASTTYTDLPTPGPTVNLTSAGTRALALWRLVQYSTAGIAVSAVDVNGATWIPAADANGLLVNDGNRTSVGWAFMTITPGLHTYKLQYRVTGGTGTFLDRQLFVLAP